MVLPAIAGTVHHRSCTFELLEPLLSTALHVLKNSVSERVKPWFVAL